MENILDVDEHAWKLDCILRTLDISDIDERWSHICTWLQMASSLEYVDLVTEKFDSSLVFCSSARHFENERTIMLSKLAKEIATFNFIWGAFESLVEELEPFIKGCNIEKYGKVSTACYIIRNKPTLSLFPGYKETLNKLQLIYESLFQTVQHSQQKRKQKISKMPQNEQAINIVYIIRNNFAHGSYSLPYHPDDYESFQFEDTDLIRVSSTIVLLTMQMMLCSYFSDQNIELSNLFLFDELDDIDSIHLIPLLRNVHIKGYEKIKFANFI